MEEEIKGLSVSDKLDKVLDSLPVEEKEKNSNWKIPFLKSFKFRVGKKKVEKGWSQIIIIRNNRQLEFTKAQVKDGIAIIDGFPRITTAAHTLFYNKKPTYIIPEWSLKPFSAEENLDTMEKEKMNIAGRRAILATLETEKIKPKKDLGSIIWVVVIVAIVGAGYYLGKNAGWF